MIINWLWEYKNKVYNKGFDLKLRDYAKLDTYSVRHLSQIEFFFFLLNRIK